MIQDRPEIKDDSRYSLTAAAKVLGVHRQTMWRWTNTNVIKFTIGKDGFRYVRGKDILDLWDNWDKLI